MTIRALIEAVEAGEAGWNRLATIAEDVILPKEAELAVRSKYAALAATAYCGSLDAALALHAALLPGTKWIAGSDAETSAGGFARIVCRRHRPMAEAHDQPTPARALLLAILRAVEAEGQP